MTEKEKMLAGMIYNPNDPELMAEQLPYLDKCHEFNLLKATETEKKQAFMKATFAECGENCYIELPFYANWAGKNLHLGRGVYANFHLTLVDDGQIYIGDRTMIGPNVTIATAMHPLEPELREQGLQQNKDVHIGKNVWIGAGAIILPGVTIGDGCVIGAGAVVTRDFPAGSVAVGCPAKVIKQVPHASAETLA